MKPRAILLTSIAAILVGCAPPSRPAAIQHVVFFELQDPADSEGLMGECDRLLRPIPSVKSFVAGPHIETGRDTILSDYDVGLVIGFDTEEGYAEYVEHPRHVELVETWRPKIAAIRVYDILGTSAGE